CLHPPFSPPFPYTTLFRSSRIAAHGREGDVRDPVLPDVYAARAEDIDGVAVLARAAVARRDVLDAIADHEGPVFAGLRTPDLDADRKSTRLNSSHVKISYA